MFYSFFLAASLAFASCCKAVFEFVLFLLTTKKVIKLHVALQLVFSLLFFAKIYHGLYFFATFTIILIFLYKRDYLIGCLSFNSLGGQSDISIHASTKEATKF